MHMKNIFIYNNAAFMLKKIYFIVLFFLCIVVIILSILLNNPNILLVMPPCVIGIFIFYYKVPLNNSMYYSSIIIDNIKNQLSFVTIYNQKKVFEYKNIQSIMYDINSEPFRRRVGINLHINMKNGETENIFFTNLEFDIKNILNNIPSDSGIFVAAPINDNRLGQGIMYIVLVMILAFFMALMQGVKIDIVGAIWTITIFSLMFITLLLVTKLR